MANDLIVMTWNVENLFRPDGTDTSAAETYAAKLTYLAGLISGTGADVVALQEIGSPQAAQDLQATLGGAWQAVVSSHLDDRGIRVAVFARHPLTARHGRQTRLPLLRSQLRAFRTRRHGGRGFGSRPA
ncbi:endonuclease/exonuclease/phosphatase family protein [Micromonospora endolithica]|uniref:endonuclease/exonuclease/phosphatase family protein n=1 Tax=Micromonospora endolithica TaxID=230091 RepID=UPI0011ADB1E9|nr:endonuclease/exonuclease/phosphatase family protein [Micromonospora endolithica]TWJ21167.1 Endonuclease/Exonuclease/phosphatase family protein [Micromonospora endolithica]